MRAIYERREIGSRLVRPAKHERYGSQKIRIRLFRPAEHESNEWTKANIGKQKQAWYAHDEPQFTSHLYLHNNSMKRNRKRGNKEQLSTIYQNSNSSQLSKDMFGRRSRYLQENYEWWSVSYNTRYE